MAENFSFAVQTEVQQEIASQRNRKLRGVNQQALYGVGRAGLAAPVTVPYAFVNTTGGSLENVSNATIGRVIPGLKSDFFDEGKQQRRLDSFSSALGNARYLDLIAEEWNDHSTGIRTTTDVATLFTGVGLINKGTRGAGAFGFIGNSRLGRKVFGDYSRVEKAFDDYHTIAKKVRDENLGVITLNAGTSKELAEGQRAIRSAMFNINPRKGPIGASVKEAISTEAAIAIFMNDSDFFFPENMNNKDYAMMGLFGLGLPLGIDNIIRGGRVRNIDAKVAAGGVGLKRELGLGVDAVDSGDVMFASAVQKQGAAFYVDKGNEATVNANAIINGADSTIKREVIKLGSLRNDDLADRAFISDAQIANVNDYVSKNPTGILGTYSIEKVTDNVVGDLATKRELARTQISEKREKLLAKKTRTANDELVLRQLDEREQLMDRTIPMALSQEGATYVSKLDDAFEGKTFGNVKIGENGTIVYGPRSKNAKALDFAQEHRRVTTAYKRAQDVPTKAAAKIASDGDYGSFIGKLAQSKRDYVQQDLNVGILRELKTVGNQRDIDAAIKGSGLDVTGIDDLIERVEADAFKLKLNAFKKLQRSKDYGEFTYLDLSRRFNLKMHDFEGNTPSTLARYMEDFTGKSGAYDRGLLIKDYENYAQGKLNVNANTTPVEPLDFSGNNFDIKDAPIMLLRDERKMQIHPANYEDMAGIAEQKMVEILEKLDYGASIFGRELDNLGAPNLVRDMLTQTSDEVSELFSRSVPEISAGLERATAGNDGTLSGFVGQVASTVLPQNQTFRNGYVTAYEAAVSINKSTRNSYERAARDWLQTKEVIFRQLHNRKNLGDLINLGEVTTSFNYGWRFTKDSRFATDKLKVADNVENRTLARELGLNDVEVQKMFANGDAVIPSPSALLKGEYQPLVITKLAGEGLTALNESQRIAQLNRATIKYANGQMVDDDIRLSLPAYTSEHEQAFIIHEIGSDKVARVFTGKNADTNLQEAERVVGQLNKERLQKGLPAVGISRAVDYKQRTGKTPELMQTGKANPPPRVPRVMLDNMLKGIIRDWGAISADAINARFRGEINYLDHMENMLKLRDANISSRKTRNIYQDVKGRLLGIDTDRPAGNLYYRGMSLFDEVGKHIGKGMEAIFEPVLETVDVLGKRETRLKKGLDKIAEETGYRPYEEFLTRNGIENANLTQDFVRKMNGFTSFFVLQFFEPAMGIINMTTLPTLLPSVGKTLARRDGESYDEYVARAGRLHNVMPENGAPRTMNMRKVMMDGMGYFFTDEGRRIAKEAKELGHLSQNYVETQDIIFNGGKALSNPTVWNKFLNLAQSPTRWTEEFSRAAPYMAFYKMYEAEAPELSAKALHKLANAAADKTIGDYSKLARPDIFRGETGQLLGLFQTFFTNYWQRMYSAFENADSKTLVTQFGTQGAIFGLEGIPGYDAFEKAWTNYDGSQTPWESLVGAYGVDYAEWLSVGTLSTFPKFFGAEDGIALHTRGDTNVRGIPNITDFNAAPAVMVGRRLQSGFGQIVELIKQEGTNTESGRIVEIAANSVPSRPFKGALEVLNGYSTDRNGGLIEDNTRTLGGMVTRFLGTKPLREARTAEMMYRQRGIAQYRNAKINIMRNNAISWVRAEGGVTPEIMQRMMTTYPEIHRDPDGFGGWMKSLVIKARKEKAARDLLEAYKRVIKNEPGPYADRETIRMFQLLSVDPSLSEELIED